MSSIYPVLFPLFRVEIVLYNYQWHFVTKIDSWPYSISFLLTGNLIILSLYRISLLILRDTDILNFYNIYLLSILVESTWNHHLVCKMNLTYLCHKRLNLNSSMSWHAECAATIRVKPFVHGIHLMYGFIVLLTYDIVK